MGVERKLRFDIKKKRGVEGTSAETPPLPEIDDWSVLNPSGEFLIVQFHNLCFVTDLHTHFYSNP